MDKLQTFFDSHIHSQTEPFQKLDLCLGIYHFFLPQIATE